MEDLGTTEAYDDKEASYQREHGAGSLDDSDSIEMPLGESVRIVCHYEHPGRLPWKQELVYERRICRYGVPIQSELFHGSVFCGLGRQVVVG